MDGQRLYVRRFETDASTAALTISVAITDLLAADWCDRWVMLLRDPRLLHLSVARRCGGDDPVLQDVIQRAAEAGVPSARREFATADALRAYSRRCESVEYADRALLKSVFDYASDALHSAQTRGARWLLPYAWSALSAAVGGDRHSNLPAAVGSVGLAILSAWRNVSARHLEEAWALGKESEWPNVWMRLADVQEPAELMSAAGVYAEHCSVFGPEYLAEIFRDLEALLSAALEQGPRSAVNQHRAVLTARQVLQAADGKRAAQQAEECRQYAIALGQVYDETATAWVAEAGLQLAERSHQLADVQAANYPLVLSTLSSRISDAVHAGCLPAQDQARAVEVNGQALSLLSEESEHRLSMAYNRSLLLGEAVTIGALPPTRLQDAIEDLRFVLSSTPEGDPRRASRLTSLGNRIYTAVEHSVIEADQLKQAVDCHREVTGLTETNDDKHAEALSNLSRTIAYAVDRSVYPPGAIVEAVELARRSIQPERLVNTAYAWRVHGFVVRVRQAVQSQQLPATVLLEVLEILEATIAELPAKSKSRPELLDILSTTIRLAVEYGLRPPSHVLQALEAATAAFDLCPLASNKKSSYADHLALTKRAAVQIGAASPVLFMSGLEVAREAVVLARDPEERAKRLSTLALLGAEAYRAGIGNTDVLLEAVASAREVAESIAVDTPQIAHRLGIYSYCLGLAVSEGLLPSEVLSDAVAYARRDVRMQEDAGMGDRDDRLTAMSELSSRLAQAVRCGIEKAEALLEALELARAVVAGTSSEHAYRGARLYGLASRVDEAIAAGLLPRERRLESLALYDEALAHLSSLRSDWANTLLQSSRSYAEAVAVGALQADVTADILLRRIAELWSSLRFDTVSSEQRARILEASEGLADTSLEVILRGAGPLAAIGAIECLRNNLLSARRPPELPADASIPAALRREYVLCTQEHEAAQARFEEGLQTVDELEKVRHNLRALVDAVRMHDGAADFASAPNAASAATRLGPGQRLLYVFAAAASGYALILEPTSDVCVVPLPSVTAEAVVDNVLTLLKAPASAQDVCRWLWQVVWTPILAVVPKEVEDCLVVPVGNLLMLPLHAAGSVEDAWLDDTVNLRVLPSGLDLSRADTAPHGLPLVAVSGMTDLKFVEPEMIVASHWLPGAAQLAGASATRDAVLTAVAEAPIALLGGHGLHSEQEGGGLVLADGVLKADHVLRLPPRRRNFAIVSACSSGQVSARLIDEAVGLPRALLWAGFETVCASLWPVRDVAAFLTTARFLESYAQDPILSAARRMRMVRRWLRTASSHDISAWFASLQQEVTLDRHSCESITAWLQQYPDAACPLEDPADWAAFAVFG